MSKVKKTNIYFFFILIIFYFTTTGFLVADINQYKADRSKEYQRKVKIRTGKVVYSSRERVIVYFQGLPGNRYDLITIVPASNPDNIVCIKTFTRRLKRGSFDFGTFEPGLYQVRIYFNWYKGAGSGVQARHSFTVRLNSRKNYQRKNNLLDH